MRKFKRKSTEQIMKEVTGIVIEGLKKGKIPWRKPWASASIGGAPQNYNHKTAYHGSNTIILTSVMMAKDYTTNYWVTYKGAKDLGGNVAKGQGGYPVVYWKFIEKEETIDGVVETIKIPFLRHFTVFNLDQLEGIEMPKKPKKSPAKPLKVIAEAEEVVTNYVEREENLTLDIKASNKARFIPSLDKIECPTIRQHVEEAKENGQSVTDGKQHYYSTMFHEMVHSTGTKERCNREGVTKPIHFGDHEYSKEELVAEIGSAILSAKLGLISDRVIENRQAYLNSWISKLESNPKWIIWAGGRSERAVKYILDES